MSQRRRRLGVTTAAVLIGAALAVTSCAGATRVARDRSATPYVASMVVDSSAGTEVGVARTVEELLPNAKFRLPWGNLVANSHTVVLGVPVAVRPDRADTWPTDHKGEVEEAQVPFDDPKAEGRYWLIDIKVSDVLAGVQPSTLLKGNDPSIVTARMASIGGPVDVKRFSAGIIDLGKSVWFLGAYKDAARDAFSIAWNGAAVARVSPSGSLDFVLVSPGLRDLMGPGDYTTGELRQLGARPDHQVDPLKVPERGH